MLVDDPNVRWPDAVLPGTESARIAARRGKERDRRIDARREQLAEQAEARRDAKAHGTQGTTRERPR